MERRLERRATAADWTAGNPVLGPGEWALETDTRRLKLGDGTTAWNDLPYFDQEMSEHLGAYLGAQATRYTTADQNFPDTVLANIVWNDDIDVLANTVYRFLCDLRYHAETAAGLKIKWTVPAGAMFAWSLGDGVSRAVGDTVTIAADDTDQVARISGLLVTSATAGVVNLQAAQGTGDATPSKTLMHSFVEFWSP